MIEDFIIVVLEYIRLKNKGQVILWNSQKLLNVLKRY